MMLLQVVLLLVMVHKVTPLTCINCGYTEDTIARSLIGFTQQGCLNEAANMPERTCEANQACIAFTGKISLKINFMGNFQNYDVELTYRNCTATEPSTLGVQSDDTLGMSEIEHHLADVSQDIQVTDIEGDTCVCDSDRCNRARYDSIEETCMKTIPTQKTPTTTTNKEEEGDSQEQNDQRTCWKCVYVTTGSSIYDSLFEENVFSENDENCVSMGVTSTLDSVSCPENHVCVESQANITTSIKVATPSLDIATDATAVFRDCIPVLPSDRLGCNNNPDILYKEIQKYLSMIPPDSATVNVDITDSVTCLCSEPDCNNRPVSVITASALESTTTATQTTTGKKTSSSEHAEPHHVMILLSQVLILAIFGTYYTH